MCRHRVMSAPNSWTKPFLSWSSWCHYTTRSLLHIGLIVVVNVLARLELIKDMQLGPTHLFLVHRVDRVHLPDCLFSIQMAQLWVDFDRATHLSAATFAWCFKSVLRNHDRLVLLLSQVFQGVVAATFKLVLNLWDTLWTQVLADLAHVALRQRDSWAAVIRVLKSEIYLWALSHQVELSVLVNFWELKRRTLLFSCWSSWSSRLGEMACRYVYRCRSFLLPRLLEGVWVLFVAAHALINCIEWTSHAHVGLGAILIDVDPINHSARLARVVPPKQVLSSRAVIIFTKAYSFRSILTAFTPRLHVATSPMNDWNRRWNFLKIA